MYTYIGLSLPFLLLVLLLDIFILRTKVVKQRSCWVILAIMLGLTAVFDQLFTGLPIVLYNYELTSGIKLWYAPIEDFSYTIAAVVGIGSVLQYVQKDDRHER